MRLSPAFGWVPPIPLYSWKKNFYAKSCTPFAESLQAGQHLMIYTLCTKAKSPCGGFEFYERKKNLELLYACFGLVRERGYEMAWRRNCGFRLLKELFAKGEENSSK